MGRNPARLAELEALPENVVGEIIAGALYVSPRPATPHAMAASRLGALLLSRFDLGEPAPGGWFILDEPELRLDEDVLVPDVAGWRRRWMPVFPRAAALTLPPDWVCEVLSPSTQTLDRKFKLPVYAREGVGHLWIVDPEQCSLEVLRLEEGRYTQLELHKGAGLVRAEPFEVLTLELALLWG
ncbi:Uma2 family endonuclease [Hyalangium sp.]|uniref:Uma2 family endonuclease n=1 Tax=Hyalangium sp. TaxID=2028555 RepID=UPI002D412170|nr:Uma2 family endonuclease [Hyalangium sp.]HYI00493.1 Uma2 family endonuclease [Hyalangium sp.]